MSELYEQIHSTSDELLLQQYEDVIKAFVAESKEHRMESEQLETSLRRWGAFPGYSRDAVLIQKQVLQQLVWHFQVVIAKADEVLRTIVVVPQYNFMSLYMFERIIL